MEVEFMLHHQTQTHASVFWTVSNRMDIDSFNQKPAYCGRTVSQNQGESRRAGLAPCSKQGNPRSQEAENTISSLLQPEQDATAAAPHDEWCPAVLCVLKSLKRERERIWLPGPGCLSAPRRRRGQKALFFRFHGGRQAPENLPSQQHHMKW